MFPRRGPRVMSQRRCSIRKLRKYANLRQNLQRILHHKGTFQRKTAWCRLLSSRAVSHLMEQCSIRLLRPHAQATAARLSERMSSYSSVCSSLATGFIITRLRQISKHAVLRCTRRFQCPPAWSLMFAMAVPAPCIEWCVGCEVQWFLDPFTLSLISGVLSALLTIGNRTVALAV